MSKKVFSKDLTGFIMKPVRSGAERIYLDIYTANFDEKRQL